MSKGQLCILLASFWPLWKILVKYQHFVEMLVFYQNFSKWPKRFQKDAQFELGHLPRHWPTFWCDFNQQKHKYDAIFALGDWPANNNDQHFNKMNSILLLLLIVICSVTIGENLPMVIPSTSYVSFFLQCGELRAKPKSEKVDNLFAMEEVLSRRAQLQYFLIERE